MFVPFLLFSDRKMDGTKPTVTHWLSPGISKAVMYHRGKTHSWVFQRAGLVLICKNEREKFPLDIRKTFVL